MPRPRRAALPRLLAGLLPLSLLLWPACTTDSTVDIPDTFTLGDIGGVDAGNKTEDGESLPDAGAAPLDCPGGAGCPCKANADCDNAICIDTLDGKRCAIGCVDSCGPGYNCVSLSAADDSVHICAPKYLRLCDPCSHSKDCQGLGAPAAVCAEFGSRGNFCATACDTSADCPNSHKCVPVTSVEGSQSKQCVPVEDNSGDPGQCSCSASAIAKGLGTNCLLSKEGGLACAGERHCGPTGLTACTAPEPKPELCDGIDNDCDGQTDESGCDDGNPCTSDLCDKTSGKCTHSSTSEGAPCNDGNVCSDKDACKQGGCTGSPVQCSDDNPCTQDTCDATKGCEHAHANGVPCNDGNLCTQGDLCADGKCQPGDAKPCASKQFCIAAQCEQKTGNCDFNPKPDGLACDDGSVCTKADKCESGTCLGAAIACDDDNPCTKDTCHAAKGCLHTSHAGPCEDGNKCTIGDTCKAGSCKAGLAKDCDDGNVCTVDGCDPNKGCTIAKVDKGCDDGDPCSLSDVCAGGVCKAGKAKVCDDGNACTADVCDAKSGKCVASAGPNNGKACAGDGDKCVVGHTCAAGKCVASKMKDCDDGDPCSKDSCDPGSGKCLHTALPDKAICAPDKWCSAGKCVSAPHCGDGKINLDIEECDDGNKADGDGCSAGCKKQGPTPKQSFILPGTFTMGCNPKEQPSCAKIDDENPPHNVKISGYWIDRYEVTVAEYTKCINAKKCSKPKFTHANFQAANHGAKGRDKHPINYVTWSQANEYCDWAGGSRLCTEAEWEYAARGADARKYPWGAKEANCKLAWFTGCGITTRAVGTLVDGQSPFAVYDMAGNVWEFVADVYSKDYYSKSPANDPKGPSAGNDPNTAERVMRGGCFTCKTDQLRASNRQMAQPPYLSAHAGIRCCRDQK